MACLTPVKCTNVKGSKVKLVKFYMAYYLNLFSPETYEAFSISDKTVSGFRERQLSAASKVKEGDKFICYMTKLSRWVGVLEVTSSIYQNNKPIFYKDDDPFTARFKVNSLVWLEKEQSVPIRNDDVWGSLSFTKNHSQNSSQWTGAVRGSLRLLEDSDGRYLENLLVNQLSGKTAYPLTEDEHSKLKTLKVKGVDKDIAVSIPQEDEEDTVEIATTQTEVRESIKIQALVANIGVKMGHTIWIPRNDRARVRSELKDNFEILAELPLNYDETTIRTIEQIDVIWLRNRSIIRAFEVEHTTSIYSGILRMADLLALQPNMDIKLNIVAPISRREKVFQELRRPVFSLLEKGPLSESCTYLSYESVRALSREKHLQYLSNEVLDQYAEEAE